MDATTIVLLIGIGLCAGILGSLVGVGGGIVIVPALMFFLGLSQLHAQGISLALIMLPVGFLGVWQYHQKGYVDMRLVGLIAVGFIAGSWIGSKIAMQIPVHVLKKLFAVLLSVVALKLFLEKKPISTHTPVNHPKQTATNQP
ncbi:MAG: sulfite exporter TauE/SafE family protein [Ferruginibacter sp.]